LACVAGGLTGLTRIVFLDFFNIAWINNPFNP